jgi:hypothetical protein
MSAGRTATRFTVMGPNEKAIAATGHELISAKRTGITTLTTAYGWPSNQNRSRHALQDIDPVSTPLDRDCRLL